MKDSGPPITKRESSSETLSQATVFELLAEPRRRYALSVLSDRSEPMSLTDLARAVADREADEADSPVPADHSRRVGISLYHAHLPRLADAGLVEFDSEGNTVAPGDVDATTEPLDQVL